MNAAEPDSPTIPYLSAEWFRQADQALTKLSPIPESVTVAVRVTLDDAGSSDTGGTPDGIVAYRLVLGPDQVRLLADDQPGDVRLTMSYATACGIAQGRTGAQRAFLDGEIQLGGDTTALLGHQRQLSQIDDQLARLRSRTSF